jgi:hypothetical protein
VTGSRPVASRIAGSGEAVEKTRTGEYPDETIHNSNYRGACRCGGCVWISLLSKDEKRHHHPNAQSRAEALANCFGRFFANATVPEAEGPARRKCAAPELEKIGSPHMRRVMCAMLARMEGDAHLDIFVELA